jgi:hypothetical protein
MKGIADTGVIVAFARRNAQHHVWAVDVPKRITEPLLRCEAVLAEAAFQLESSSYVLALLQDKMLRLGLRLQSQYRAAGRTRPALGWPQPRSGRSLFDTNERTVSSARCYHS